MGKKKKNSLRLKGIGLIFLYAATVLGLYFPMLAVLVWLQAASVVSIVVWFETVSNDHLPKSGDFGWRSGGGAVKQGHLSPGLK